MARLDVREAPRHLVEGLLPADARPAVAGTAERVLLAVRIEVHVLERGRLGAEVALAERVLRVAADGADALVLHLDAQPAHGLAEVAGAVVDAGLGHDGRGP